jgi:hypothetical protein
LDEIYIKNLTNGIKNRTFITTHSTNDIPIKRLKRIPNLLSLKISICISRFI